MGLFLFPKINKELYPAKTAAVISKQAQSSILYPIIQKRDIRKSDIPLITIV